jgi:hypothetical protein
MSYQSIATSIGSSISFVQEREQQQQQQHRHDQRPQELMSSSGVDVEVDLTASVQRDSGNSSTASSTFNSSIDRALASSLNVKLRRQASANVPSGSGKDPCTHPSPSPRRSINKSNRQILKPSRFVGKQRSSSPKNDQEDDDEFDRDDEIAACATGIRTGDDIEPIDNDDFDDRLEYDYDDEYECLYKQESDEPQRQHHSLKASAASAAAHPAALNHQSQSKSFDALLQDSRVLLNLLHVEDFYRIQSNYFVYVQSEIKPWMRKMLSSWMLDVCNNQSNDADVFVLAINILDRFLSMQPIGKRHLQLLGTVCMFIAAKLRGCDKFDAETLVIYTANSITIDELLVCFFCY